MSYKTNMKANCLKCLYGGCYNPTKKIASCDCKDITEDTVIEYDDIFKKNRVFVRRESLDQETDCPNFIPNLSEDSDNYILEEVYSSIAHLICPFCGQEITEYDLSIEETRVIECANCNHKLCISGKQI